jgi:hypothetical protein
MMAKELDIPKEYELAFNRVMQRVPIEFREDKTIRRTALIYLKLGGEKLARASIKAFTTPFSEKFILRKMQLNDDDFVKKADSDGNGDGATEEKGEEPSKVESVDTNDTESSPTSEPSP